MASFDGTTDIMPKTCCAKPMLRAVWTKINSQTHPHGAHHLSHDVLHFILRHTQGNQLTTQSGDRPALDTNTWTTYNVNHPVTVVVVQAKTERNAISQMPLAQERESCLTTTYQLETACRVTHLQGPVL